MRNQTVGQDSNLRRLVRDFDALADVLHHLIERERPLDSRHEAIAERETEFTTEWQMVAAVAEETPSA